MILLWKRFMLSDFYLFKMWSYKIKKITQACCKKCQQFIKQKYKIHIFSFRPPTPFCRDNQLRVFRDVFQHFLHLQAHLSICVRVCTYTYIFLNVCIQTGLFNTYDFLNYISYLMTYLAIFLHQNVHIYLIIFNPGIGWVVYI